MGHPSTSRSISTNPTQSRLTPLSIPPGQPSAKLPTTQRNIPPEQTASPSQHLMEDNLIDQYWIFINPVILGRGIQLYPKGSDLKKFTLAKQEVFPNGEIALCYEKQ